jgi:hypothetical protein
MARSFFVENSHFAPFVNSRHISESDFSDVTTKDILHQLMLHGDTGMSYNNWNPAFTWPVINMSCFIEMLAEHFTNFYTRTRLLI